MSVPKRFKTKVQKVTTGVSKLNYIKTNLVTTLFKDIQFVDTAKKKKINAFYLRHVIKQ